MDDITGFMAQKDKKYKLKQIDILNFSKFL
jgi:hypothetical protein